MSTLQDIEEKAASWLAREDCGLDAAGRAQLEAWLNEDTGRRVVYLRLKGAWRRADRLAALKAPSLPRRPKASAGTWRLGRRVFAGAVALAAACALVLYLYPPGGNIYETGVGQQKTIRLSDGTQIELNTDTQLRTDVTAKVRTVTLDRGEAFFDVVHNPARPFVVLAGNRRIVDLGTRFSVRRDGNNIEVLVAYGRVRVDVLGAHGYTSTVLAQTGDAVLTKGGEALVTRKTSQTIKDALQWRKGVLVFNQETLADVADEFNRYNRKQMVVVGDARDIRLGGRFRADNLDAFTTLIRKGLGLKVRNKDDKIIVSNR